MFQTVTLRCQIVWEDVLWTVLAVWQEDDASEPIVMEKSGRCSLGGDSGPDAVLSAAVAALQGEALEGRR
jgi:hypothetical protein